MRGFLGKSVCAAFCVGLTASPALAQAIDPQAQDAAQPAPPPPDPADSEIEEGLAPLPELDLPWPEIDDSIRAEAIEELSDFVDPVVEDEEVVITDPTLDNYAYELVGLPTADAEQIRDDFASLSALDAGDGEADNAAQIDRRAQTDVILLAEILRSRGYYAADIEVDYEPRGEVLLVRLQVDPGRQFTFVDVQTPGLEAARDEDEPALREALGVRPGDPVLAGEVIAGTAALDESLGRSGYASAQLGERQVILDYANNTATLVQPVTTGTLSRFGQIRVEGIPPFPPRHVQRIARFEPGEIYDQDLVVDLRRALIQTRLVSSVAIDIEPQGEAGDVVDLAVRLEPAKMRTIAAEAGYGTDQGIRLEGSWQHRNFWNPEGALTLRGVLGTQEQLVSASMVRSNWLRRDQRLSGVALVGALDRPAYKANTAQLSLGVERVSDLLWQKEWTYGIGVELIATDELDIDVEQSLERRRTFFIGALPARLNYDGSDSLLDPTTGFRVNTVFSPEVSLQDEVFTYLRTSIEGIRYQPVGFNTVLAGRVKVGTIYGAERSDIAPSRRFYAGGGGSVRGYGYQALGPRDAFDDPIGGTSLSEFALEARVRFGNFGVVPFVDGGRVGTDSAPGIDGWQYAVGIGARYYSNFGPIRVDVGVPLNPREGDAPVAVVVGLGQAF